MAAVNKDDKEMQDALQANRQAVQESIEQRLAHPASQPLPASLRCECDYGATSTPGISLLPIMQRERVESRFSAVVLTGGRSARMGTDKAFVRVGDELLIERQLRCLRESGASQLLISGRADVDYSRFATTVIHDEYPQAGPLAGVAAALKASVSPFAFVLAVDMPKMTPAMIRKILSQCENDVGRVPFDGHRFQPLGAAFPISLLPLAEHLLRGGQCSMREFVVHAIREGFIQTLQLEQAEHVYFTNMNFPHEWAGISE